jgi:hypothetical protein
MTDHTQHDNTLRVITDWDRNATTPPASRLVPFSTVQHHERAILIAC